MDEALRRQILSIIDDMDDLTIATVRDDGYPQATTVSYVNDGFAIYFGTSADSQKARNIARNAKVSLTINRPYRDWSEIEGLSMGGIATRVTEAREQQKVGALMFGKFPQIQQYVPVDASATDLALFRIDPQVISLLDYRVAFGHTREVALPTGGA